MSLWLKERLMNGLSIAACIIAWVFMSVVIYRLIFT